VKKQRGVSLTGLIVVLVLLGMGAMLGMKLFTPYMQYFAIQKTFKALAQNPELRSGNRRDILNAYQPYSLIDSITAISEDDIEITKDGNRLVLSANYSVKVPLVANFSLLIDFAPSSASK
jgi:hypothetical protein